MLSPASRFSHSFPSDRHNARSLAPSRQNTQSPRRSERRSRILRSFLHTHTRSLARLQQQEQHIFSRSLSLSLSLSPSHHSPAASAAAAHSYSRARSLTSTRPLCLSPHSLTHPQSDQHTLSLSLSLLPQTTHTTLRPLRHRSHAPAAALSLSLVYPSLTLTRASLSLSLTPCL